ncbi:DEAD-box ATP-dependent RNA helicase [Mortierella polycephala]|uniref:RNA helicase n=1 Tax=Mortierella polycephala TaxID=41804 RepID=A0A9P6Q9U4_9FUNG|nr:DEAD-box ATP-dependent RNA helicase [Mortierella polycephala]
MNKTVGKWVPPEVEDTSKSHAWASERPVYEWDPKSTKDSALVDTRLERQLFDGEFRINSGINFKKYAGMKVYIKDGPLDLVPLKSFGDANLDSTVMDNIRRMQYSEPTPIQNYDLMACAQTGSGKTAAFLVPIISTLVTKTFMGRLNTVRPSRGNNVKASPFLLIILPTRELAIQIFEEARRFTYMTPLRPAVVYGGSDVHMQRAKLMSKGCDILVATPGRLKDFIERGVVSLSCVRHVVLDEADRMLDMGFEGDIRSIVLSSDLARDEGLQTLMFSATFPRDVQILAKDFLKDNYCRLRIGRIGGTTSDIRQVVLFVEEHDKRHLLEDILMNNEPTRTMIFVETKRAADNLDDYLYNRKFPTCSIHGDRSQRERESSLTAFKAGRSPILIATAVASRGLDIKDVNHIVNYDLCNDIDEYVHRIGRTARAGNPGKATTFYNHKNEPIAPQLTKLLVECKQEVPEFLRDFVSEHTTFETDDFHEEEGDYQQQQQQNLGGVSTDGRSTAAWDHKEGTWGASDNTARSSDDDNTVDWGWSEQGPRSGTEWGPSKATTECDW